MSEYLYVGIDFGSLNTAAVASNGHRKAIPTEVGWARDHLAEKRLGGEPLFGEELRKHRLALKTCRPFAKGALKFNDDLKHHGGGDEHDTIKAADCVLREILRLVVPGQSRGVRGVVGVPAKASVLNKKLLLKLSEHWMESVILVPEPFAVAYGVGSVEPSVIIDIGAGTIDFCHFYGALPEEEDLETVHFGGDHVDAKLVELVTRDYADMSFSPSIAREVKEKFGFIGPAPEPVVIRLPSRTGKPGEIDITEQVAEACTSLGYAVLQGLDRLLQRIAPEYQSTAIRNILLAGGGSQLRGLDIWLEDQLTHHGQVQIHRISDFAFAGASGALQLAMELPAAGWSELLAQRSSGTVAKSVEATKSQDGLTKEKTKEAA